MAEEHHSLELVMRRAGIFDGRTIHARQFRDDQGKLVWHVTTWPEEGDPIDDYWVEGDEFREIVRLDMYINLTPNSRVEIGRLIVEMNEQKRKSILGALAKWQEEFAEISCT